VRTQIDDHIKYAATGAADDLDFLMGGALKVQAAKCADARIERYALLRNFWIEAVGGKL
jgi:hypothetical protein